MLLGGAVDLGVGGLEREPSGITSVKNEKSSIFFHSLAIG